MKDDFKKFVNVRQPQKNWKWKMTSKDLKMEDKLILTQLNELGKNDINLGVIEEAEQRDSIK